METDWIKVEALFREYNELIREHFKKFYLIRKKPKFPAIPGTNPEYTAIKRETYER